MPDWILHTYYFLLENYVEMFVSLLGLIVGLEGIARFTPTKKDDAILERIGGWIRKGMDWLKIPNIKK